MDAQVQSIFNNAQMFLNAQQLQELSNAILRVLPTQSAPIKAPKKDNIPTVDEYTEQVTLMFRKQKMSRKSLKLR